MVALVKLTAPVGGMRNVVRESPLVLRRTEATSNSGATAGDCAYTGASAADSNTTALRRMVVLLLIRTPFA
jgi:hypothetical protein